MEGDSESKGKRRFIKILAWWTVLFTGVLTVLNVSHPVARAVFGMAWILLVGWVGICGWYMYKHRVAIREKVLRIPLPWQVTFVIFATLLAMLEEAITTTATNLAPAFGVAIGQAYITASTNYFDVIFFHSVIVFIGPFVCWALVLKRYDFSPFAVFVLFGLFGIMAESLAFGLQNLLDFAQWIFVYGLMVFLPAYCVPSASERGARRAPRWYHYLLMIFLPALFVPLVAWLPHVIDPQHPTLHFPPINSGM